MFFNFLQKYVHIYKLWKGLRLYWGPGGGGDIFCMKIASMFISRCNYFLLYVLLENFSLIAGEGLQNLGLYSALLTIK
jgi:hypothetical protein